MVAFRTCFSLTVLAFSPTSDAFVLASSSSRFNVGFQRSALPGRSKLAALHKAGICIADESALPAGEALRVRGGGAGGAGGAGVSLDGKIGGKDGDERMLIARLWDKYLVALEKQPLVTKALSSGVIAGSGNFIEQTLSPTAFSLVDWSAFTLVAPVFVGPGLHFWHNVLDRLGNSKAVTSRVSNKWGRVLVQIAVDQSVGASFMNSGYFALHTIFLAVLTGTAFPLQDLGSSIVDKVTGNYVTMIVSNAKLWPWVGLFNFGFVPVHLRVLVCNFTAVLWDYLMSKWCR